MDKGSRIDMYHGVTRVSDNNRQIQQHNLCRPTLFVGTLLELIDYNGACLKSTSPGYMLD